MAIRQRGKGYRVDVQVRGQRVRLPASTHDEALKLEAEVRSRLLAGESQEDIMSSAGPETAVTPRRKTLGHLRDVVYEEVWKDSKAARTADLNSQQIVDHFGRDRPIHTIQTEDIREWVKVLKKLGNSGGTINRKLAALSKMLRYAAENRWLQNLPHIPRQRESEHRVRYFSAEEERDLLATLTHFGQPDLADFVAFLIDTGVRLSEALRLTWSDIEGDKFYARKTKNGTERLVPMTQRVQSIITARRPERPHPKQGPWHDLDEWKIRREWDKAREHMGLDDDPQFVIHACRHTFCSRLAQAGVELIAIRDLAGHKSLQTTLRYAHLAPRNLANAIRTLEGYGSSDPSLKIAV